jgi:hypothetical protein
VLAYVLLNPVAAGLVEFPGQYPGYTSWHQHVGEDQPERHIEEPPPITPPPMWKDLTPEELAEKGATWSSPVSSTTPRPGPGR